MKRISALLLFSLIVFGFMAFGQNDGGVSIGKGDIPANNKAILELVSSNKGLLITRMTTDQRNAMFYGMDVSARGLMVFDNTLNAFYFWDGYAWKAIGSGNIRTISGSPTFSGTAGEMVFDVLSSCLYIYSGGNWFNLSALKSIEAVDVKKVRNTSVGMYSDDVQSAIWELSDKIKTIGTPTGGGMISVARDLSLAGSGTSALPLGVASGGIGTSHLGSNVVTEEKIANNAVSVEKIRGGGNDKVLTTNGSGTTVWMDKSSLGGGTFGTGLVHDGTLSGNGTAVDPLKISNQNASSGAVLQWSNNTTLGWIPSKVSPVNLEGVVGKGDLNQSLVSDGSGGFKWRTIEGGAGSGEIADGAVTTVKIANGAITSAKIANGAIQGNHLNSMGASGGQVLQWNGSAWTPTTISTGIGSVSLSGENYLTLTGTALTANKVNLGTNVTGTLAATSLPVLTGDVTTTTGSMATTIADGVVTTTKIANGTILAADLSSMGLTNAVADQGKVLQWNGTLWAPATVSSGGDADPDPSNEIELPNKTGNANKILAVNATATAVQWIDPPNGGGFPASITSPTTVSLGNNNLTFTNGGGTGQVVVGNMKTAGAVYGKVRVNTTDFSIWNADDYIVILRISGAQNITLPNPATNVGRILIVRNDSGNGGVAATYTFIGNVPVNNSSLTANPAGKGMMLVSDGVSWFCVAGGS